MTDLRHDILQRQAMMAAAMEGRDTSSVTAVSPPMSHSSRMSVTSEDDDDDQSVYTPVHTRPSTPIPSTSSRARTLSSRASTPAGSRSSSPTRLARKRLQNENDRKYSLDPLKRFENAVSSRIFKELDVVTLARCARVSKAWRRSATINWAWYVRFQERRQEGPLTTEPVWTRRESKENWSQRYRSAFTLGGLQYQTAYEMELEKARSDGYRTPKEQREEKWAAEASGSGAGSGSLNDAIAGLSDKVAAREFYKSLGGRSKVKGKNTFGSSTGPRDRTAYGDGDDY